MEYSPRFQLQPTQTQQDTLDFTLDTVRQVYNHGLYRFNQIPKSEGTVKQRVTHIRDELPQLKTWWDDLNKIYSKVLQTTIERIAINIQRLGQLKQHGHKVGSLNWKSPQEFKSFTYNQSGFELDKKSGPNGYGVLKLSKIAEIPIRLHRDLPEHEQIKEVTVKQEPTGDWYASFCITVNEPDKPNIEAIEVKDTVGIDLGVSNFVFDSAGRAVQRLDLSDERERVEREQRTLSRKEYGSKNWEEQRRNVARVHEEMTNKKHDFKHKLAHFYTSEYDAVFVEDLDVKPMLESPRNARNMAEVGWGDFVQVLKHHGDKNGCYVVEVPACGTTKACSKCGVETEKPLWVREHSCPSCGFELDRDWNAALNVVQDGLSKLGVVHSEGTLVETGTTVGDDSSESVSASSVVEAGSPALKEAALAAE